MTEEIQVRVKAGCQHRQEHESYDPKKPTGNPGPLALGGEVITVSQAEMDAHGDKFTLLDPVSAVLNKQNGAAPASVPEPVSVEETARQRRVADLEAANDGLQAELVKARSRALKSEQSAKRARATLKSERKKNQAAETPDKSASDQAKAEA